MAKQSWFIKVLKKLGKGATNLAAGGVNLGVDTTKSIGKLAKGTYKIGGKALEYIDRKAMEPLSKKLLQKLGLPEAPKILKNGKLAKLKKLKGPALKKLKAFKRLEKEMPQVKKLIDLIRKNGSKIRKGGLLTGAGLGGASVYSGLINQPDSLE